MDPMMEQDGKDCAKSDPESVRNLCEVCTSVDIDSLFKRELSVDDKLYDRKRLGSLETIYSKRSKCQFCSLLISAIDNARVASGKKPTSNLSKNDRENLSCSLDNRIAGISEASRSGGYVNVFGTGWRDGLWHFRISVSVYGSVARDDGVSRE
jgi:hypothetical protein